MKAIILDVDGTLWDTTGVVAEAWMQAASELMIPLDTPITADRLKQEFGKPMDEIAANLFPTLSESQRALVMESCCEYEEFYLENAREHLLFDGVKETILTLSQNYAVCIVSNCQKGYIELFLKKTGLENAITDFECFGNTGLSKGENIRLLMERAQITDAVYVGDTKGDADACTLPEFRLFCRIRIRFSHSLCSQNHAFSRITGISLLKKYRSTVRSDTFLLVLIIQTCTLCHKRTHICIRYFDMLRMCRIRFDIFRFFKRCHKRHIMST